MENHSPIYPINNKYDNIVQCERKEINYSCIGSYLLY